MLMPKFSELGDYCREFREKEIEDFNLNATEQNLKFSRRTYIVAVMTFVVAIITLIVSLLK